jgi:hypothetical protein
MIDCVRMSHQASHFLTTSMVKSMHVDVLRPSVSRQFVGAGIRADGFTSKKETASWHGDSFLPTPAERSLDLGLSITDSV